MKTNLFLIFCLFVFSIFIYSCDGIDEDCNFCENIQMNDSSLSNGDCQSLCSTCFNPSDSAGTTANCVCNFIEVLLEAQGLKWKDLADMDNGDDDVIIIGDGANVTLGNSNIKNHGQCVKAVKNSLADN